MTLRMLLPALLLLCAQLAWADPADRYNRVTFQSVASREVPNDLLVARMGIVINGKEPARIAQKLTSALNAALKKAEAYPKVAASSGDQHTEAVYNRQNQLVGYRGRAEIRLESRDFEAMAKLIARLQSGMQVTGMDFGVAPETRKQVESALIADAENDYKKNAQAISLLLNGTGFKLVNQVISQSGSEAPGYEFYEVLADKAQSNKPLNLTGGKSEIRVQITSTIEITP